MEASLADRVWTVNRSFFSVGGFDEGAQLILFLRPRLLGVGSFKSLDLDPDPDPGERCGVRGMSGWVGEIDMIAEGGRLYDYEQAALVSRFCNPLKKV